MRATSENSEQYGLLKIIPIWLLTTIPMPIGAFVLAPLLTSNGDWDFGIVVWSTLIVGMIW